MTTRTWSSEWDALVLPPTEVAAAKCIDECIVRRVHMINCIARFAPDDLEFAKRLAARFIRSHSALVAVLAMAARRQNLDVDASTIIKAALDPGLLTQVTITPRLGWIERPNGGRRPVFKSHWLMKALERHAHQATKLMGGRHPRQFLFNGGIEAAAHFLSHQMEAKRFIAITDFPSCYLTVNRKRLVQTLPLTGQQQEALITRPMDQVITAASFLKGPDKEDRTTLRSIVSNDGAAPMRGVPPGNALSAIAAELALRPILDAVEKKVLGVKVATFADNLVISAPTENRACAAVAALLHVTEGDFGSWVADQLRRRMTLHQPQETVCWLRREFTLDGCWVRQQVPALIRETFGAMIVCEASSSVCSGDIERLHRRVAGWSASHSYDPAVAKWTAELALDVDEIAVSKSFPNA